MASQNVSCSPMSTPETVVDLVCRFITHIFYSVSTTSSAVPLLLARPRRVVPCTRARQILLATSQKAVWFYEQGFKMRWMTWQTGKCLSPSDRHCLTGLTPTHRGRAMPVLQQQSGLGVVVRVLVCRVRVRVARYDCIAANIYLSPRHRMVFSSSIESLQGDM